MTPASTVNGSLIDPKRRAPAMIVVILLGLIAAVFVYRLGDVAESNRVQASFERVAGERIAAVESGLLTTISSLQPIASFIKMEDPTAEEYHRFVAPLLASQPGVQAFNWAPVVENADRARVEAEVDHWFSGFHILELSAHGMVVAAERARYFPVTMAEPLRGNERVIGFDLGSEPVRRTAIEAAIESGAPQATGRITLVQEISDQFAFLVFYPVSDDSGRLRGLVLGVFRVGDVVNRLGRLGAVDAELTLTIRDLAAGSSNAQMYPTKPGAASLRPVSTIATSRTLAIGGRPWRVEAVATPGFLRRERGWLPQVLLVAWLFLAGNIVWLVDRRYAVEGEVRDRTAEIRQARDEARAASGAKSDFLATMSHEIRTPLNGVVALADHLLEQEHLSEQRDSLKIIAQSGEHLLMVINDILDFSKLEANKFELEIRPFDPEKSLRNAVALFSQQAIDKGLTLNVRVIGALPDKVEGDSARLRQILLNIISNAVKFTETGAIDVEVSAEPSGGGLWFLSFTIRDTGPGMSDKTRAQLFTEFCQADNSIARRFGGTGLGLAISRRLAQFMGGTIDVVSAPGVGSAFTLRAPFAEVEAPAAPPDCAPEPIRPALAEPKAEPKADPKAEPKAEPLHDFSGRSILLAEDNPTNRAIARAILARTGARIVEAHDGVQALAAASSDHFDLILMDVHMPHMTGLEAARAIRALPEPFSRTPIIALTASAFEDDRDQCRAAGMNEFLAKPYRGGPLRDLAARTMSPRAPAPGPRLPAAGAPHHDAPAFESERHALLGAEIGEEQARGLLREFMEHAQSRLEVMDSGLGLPGLREEAHALKSSAAVVGLARFAAIACELEAAAKRDDASAADSLRTAARAAFDAARPDVAKILTAA